KTYGLEPELNRDYLLPDANDRFRAASESSHYDPAPMPSGTVTFLFTDIEGSSKLWERCPESMQAALARHDRLLRDAIEKQRGYVFKTMGDAFCAAFPTAHDALNAALNAQLALLEQDWGEIRSIKVRMALHTGEAVIRD